MSRALLFIMALVLVLHVATPQALGQGSNVRDEESYTNSQSPGRFLAHRSMTCEKFPRVCRAKGSPGPDCCRKHCVNVMDDSLNCGWCGGKCGYGEACCGGRCVNVMYDPKNCGGCKKRCNKGDYCQYGMCNYS